MVSYDSDQAVISPKTVISIRGLIKLCGRDTCGRPIGKRFSKPKKARNVVMGGIKYGLV